MLFVLFVLFAQKCSCLRAAITNTCSLHFFLQHHKYHCQKFPSNIEAPNWHTVDPSIECLIPKAFL